MSTGSGNRGDVRIEEPTRSQRTVARRAAESRATIPDLELTIDVDMTACVAASAQQSASMTAILIKACALALREVPRANASYRDGHFELYGRVNVGLVLPSSDALVIPVLFDADHTALAQLSAEAARLADRAQTGALTPPELSGATFTLADVGAHGVASASPVIVPPHAAAVTAGALRESVSVREGAVVPRLEVTVTLAADHRILYGLDAYRFVNAIKDRLERVEL